MGKPCPGEGKKTPCRYRTCSARVIGGLFELKSEAEIGWWPTERVEILNQSDDAQMPLRRTSKLYVRICTSGLFFIWEQLAGQNEGVANLSQAGVCMKQCRVKSRCLLWTSLQGDACGSAWGGIHLPVSTVRKLQGRCSHHSVAFLKISLFFLLAL